MITVTESFDVPSPPDIVWAVLAAPEDVVSCVDGASLGERYDDGSFAAGLLVRFGPLRVKFTARATVELDAESRRGQVTAHGRDAQGGTRMRTSATYDVTERDDGGSHVAIVAEVILTGKLASVVESGASVVARRLTEEFAANLAVLCAQTADQVPDVIQPPATGTSRSGPQSSPSGRRRAPATLRRLLKAFRRWRQQRRLNTPSR